MSREAPASPKEAANRLDEIRKRWAAAHGTCWVRVTDVTTHDGAFVERADNHLQIAIVHHWGTAAAIAAAPEDVAYLLAEVERLTAPDAYRAVAGVLQRLEAERQDLARRLEASERELDEVRGEIVSLRTRCDGYVEQLVELTMAGDLHRKEGDEAIAALHAVLAALRAGVPLPPDVLDDVTRLAAEAYERLRVAYERLDAIRLASRAPLTEDLVVAVQGLAAVYDEYARILDLLSPEERKDPVAAVAALVERDEHALRTRADVEARLNAVLSGPDFERTVPRFARAAWAFVRDFDGELEDRTATVDLVCAVLGVPHG